MLNQQLLKSKVHPQALLLGEAFCCGVEHELENVNQGCVHNSTLLAKYGIKAVEDHSLVDGIELLAPPAGVDRQVEIHSKIQNADFYVDHEHHSLRTSTHVHVNMAYMSPEQTLSLLKMYALLEPFFFAFVGKDRETNIHCVPLWATVFTKNLYKFPPDASTMQYVNFIEAWSKYTALNIAPLRSISTIEFRHLCGTENSSMFEKWLLLLQSLYNWALFDKGRFHAGKHDELLQTGYSETLSYCLEAVNNRTLNGLTKIVNKERLYDVYLTALCQTFGPNKDEISKKGPQLNVW